MKPSLAVPDLAGRPPLGLKPDKPVNGTKAGKDHMARVKQLPCVICGKPGPSDAHHCFCGRYGQRKSSDFETLPLCKNCHQHGPLAIHNDKAGWIARNGNDFDYLPAVRTDYLPAVRTMLGYENG